jgi:hypothetical protein
LNEKEARLYSHAEPKTESEENKQQTGSGENEKWREKSLLDPRPAHGTESRNKEHLRSELQTKSEKEKITAHKRCRKIKK